MNDDELSAKIDEVTRPGHTYMTRNIRNRIVRKCKNDQNRTRPLAMRIVNILRNSGKFRLVEPRARNYLWQRVV